MAELKHILRIISLHDAQAECSCGGWFYSFSGRRTKSQIRRSFTFHESAATHNEQLKAWPSFSRHGCRGKAIRNDGKIIRRNG